MGTPPQKTSVGVDVGTYMTTVLDSCSGLYFDEDKCQGFGTYNESLSKTSILLGGDDSLEFDDGSKWRMSNYADDFTITGEGQLVHRSFLAEFGTDRV